jgi:hypothetical protein
MVVALLLLVMMTVVTYYGDHYSDLITLPELFSS